MAAFNPIACPFCGEDDFDKVGLKNHLLRYCGEFSDVQSVEEERAAHQELLTAHRSPLTTGAPDGR